VIDRPTQTSGRRALTQVAVVFALWTLFGVLSALQVFVRDLSGIEGATPLAVFNIVYFYWGWAIVTPGVVRLVRDVANDERRWLARIASRLPLAIALMAAQSALYATMAAIEPDVSLRDMPQLTLDAFLRHLPGNSLLIATLIGAFVAFRYYQETQGRLLRATELEASLATARLETLQAQLQPHFLFNTLNLISSLVAKGDSDDAMRAIARLGDLLRESLAAGADQTVPLEHELDITRRYLEIARLRFGDRLQVRESLDDRVARARVPALLLQPLVENAIQHGIASREQGGTIWITTGSTPSGAVNIAVDDDGPGFNGSAAGGVGLANTRARLTHLYQGSASLSTVERAGGGASVVVELPFQP
jgi:signal transduction histidine kinase